MANQYTKKIRETWTNMNKRVSSTKANNFYRYGGRGIKCQWQTFEDFYNDMAATHFYGATLERIDNDGDYCKENCRWATRKEQANNTRRNRHFTIDGDTKTLAQWIDLSGIKSSTVRQRFYVYGWGIERSLGRVG